MPKGNCEFSGNGGQYFSTVFIHLFLISMFTFGIYSAWAWVRLLKLKASHTTINGKPVSFTGTGGQLFSLMLVHGLLTVITAGFYFPWAICKFFAWRTQNTLVGEKPGEFSGTGGSLFLFYLIHLMLLPMITLGIYSFWGIYKFYAWKEERTKYGGEKTSFGAGFWEFVKISFISNLLILVTLYLFSPWAMCMLFRWQINGLAVGDGEEVEHFPPVQTNIIVVAALIVIGLLPVSALGLFMKTQYDNMQQMKLQMEQTKRLEALKKKKKYRVPKPEQPAQAQQKPAPKPATKTTPPPAKPQPKAAPPVKPIQQEKINFEFEMTRLNNLINIDDKNSDAHYNRAWLMEFKGDLEGALKDYSRATELNKKHVDAYYNRGLVYVKMKKYEEAIKDFSEVLKTNPRSLDAMVNRANAYLAQGKTGPALRDYNDAIKIKPRDGDLYYNRAAAYHASGDDEKAKEDHQKAEELGYSSAKQASPSPSASGPTDLRKAALDCRMEPFLSHMVPATKQKVLHFESIRTNLDRALDKLFETAKQFAGGKVERQKGTVRFLIKGEDPRWSNVFGPQWKEIIKQKPNEPRFFMINVAYSWQEECTALQKFQACLEDPSFCQEQKAQGSALQMRKVDGSWRLITEKGKQEWDEVFKLGQGLLEIMQWANDYLAKKRGRMPYEELMLSLAEGYMERLTALPANLQKPN